MLGVKGRILMSVSLPPMKNIMRLVKVFFKLICFVLGVCDEGSAQNIFYWNYEALGHVLILSLNLLSLLVLLATFAISC